MSNTKTLKELMEAIQIAILPVMTIINDQPKILWYVGCMQTDYCFPEETHIMSRPAIVHIDNRYNERHLMEFLKSPSTAEFLSVEDALAWAKSLADIRAEATGNSSFMKLPAVMM
jgi:hypothetical protein